MHKSVVVEVALVSLLLFCVKISSISWLALLDDSLVGVSRQSCSVIVLLNSMSLVGTRSCSG